MRLLIPVLSLIFLHGGIAAPVVPNTRPASAQPAANWQSAERAKILAGAPAIPKLGAPGPVAIWGPYAFPVIAAGESGKAETALVAAAGFEKGRIVLFGHNSYLNPGGGNEASVGTLLVNLVKWSTQKQKPRVGTNDAKSEAFIKAKGLDGKKLEGGPKKK